jgi:hypothetical protein
VVAQGDRVVIRHADLGAVDIKIRRARDSFLSITNPFIRIKNFVAYLSEPRRDFLASVGITYAVFRIAKSRLRAFGEIC